MRKLITAILLFATMTTFGQQNGGDISNIKLKNSAGTKDDWWRTGHAAYVNDSVGNIWLNAMKLKIDSLYTKLQASIAVTGTFWQATQPVSLASVPSHAVTNAGTFAVQVDSSTQRQYIKINGTVPVTLDSSLTRSAVKVTQLPAINITNTSFAVTNAGTFQVQVDSSLQRSAVKVTQLPAINITNTAFTANAGTNLNTSALALESGGNLANIKLEADSIYNKLKDTINIRGNITATSTAGATVIYDSTVTATSMTVTNLSALASSATAGWQSARVSNLSAKASDYKITVRVSMANTAPANDKAIYVYAVPWGSTDGGTTWYSSTGGTTTSPSGSEGTYTIVSSAPTNFRLLGVLNYQTADMNPCDNFLLSNAFGNVMPDAWSLVFINFSGAALETNSGANNLVSYSPVYKTQR